jgi:hypothetical protein
MNSFCGEVRIGALQPGPRLLPLDVLGLEQAPDLAALDRQPVLGELSLEPIEGPRARGRHLPVRWFLWFGRQPPRFGHHLAVHALGVDAWAAGPRGVVQPDQALGGEALDPLPHRLRTHAQLLRDDRRAEPLRCKVNDSCPPHEAHRGALRPHQPRNLLAFRVRQCP